MTIEKDFVVIEKAGYRREAFALFEELKPFGIIEFVLSGRVAVARNGSSIGREMHEVIEFRN